MWKHERTQPDRGGDRWRPARQVRPADCAARLYQPVGGVPRPDSRGVGGKGLGIARQPGGGHRDPGLRSSRAAVERKADGDSARLSPLDPIHAARAPGPRQLPGSAGIAWQGFGSAEGGGRADQHQRSQTRAADHDHLGGGDEMIVGTGVDLAEVPRIRASIERFGARFIERIYTAAEIAYVERKANRWERYAARFAAKEAGMKAIGTGWRHGVRWQDFEVANLPSGKPTLRLYGVAAQVADRLGVRNVALSITHTAELGMAHVILED